MVKDYILIQLYVFLHIACIIFWLPTLGLSWKIITYLERKSKLVRQYEKEMSEMRGW